MDPGMMSGACPNSGNSLEDTHGFQSSLSNTVLGYKLYAAEQLATEALCLASSGYVQCTTSLGEEAVPFASSRSDSPAPARSKTDGLQTPKVDGFGTRQVASLVPNCIPASSSNISQLTPCFHSPKQFDKVPQSIYNFESVRPKKQCNSVGNLPSANYQKRGLIPHAGHVPGVAIDRTWIADCSFEVRERCDSNTDVIAQLSRGPRSRKGNTSSNASLQKLEVHPTCKKRGCNLPEFQTHYESAKFYVIKSYSEDDIHRCIKYDVWSSTPNGNKKLDAAFRDAEVKTRELGSKCPLFLFFSVNASGQFVGLAEMIGKVDFNKTMDFWQDDKWIGFFPVKWHIIKDIPNYHLRHTILENNNNRPVTYTRDTQEIESKLGLEMLRIFKNYSAKTSILEDFDFYEIRAKAKTKIKYAAPQMEMSGYDNWTEHYDFAVEYGELGYKIRRSGPPLSSLLEHTMKLSIA